MRTELVETTAGRVIFNTVIPDELGFVNRVMDRKGLQGAHRAVLPPARARRRPPHLVDGIKASASTTRRVAGITIGIDDIKVPSEKVKLLAEADAG